MSTSEQLLSDFIDAWNAGRRPSVREYLARAPTRAARDQLAGQLEAWLELAPTPAYDQPTRAAIRQEPAVRHLLDTPGEAAGAWAAVLPRLRERAGLSEEDLAARLVEYFDLEPADTERTADYVGRLEAGRLDPARASRRLLGALGELLGASARWLAELATPPPLLASQAPGGTLLRSEPETADWVRDDIEALSRAALTPAPPPMDDLDRLFTGGPDA